MMICHPYVRQCPECGHGDIVDDHCALAMREQVGNDGV